MGSWRFLTNHARALVLIARDPVIRLRDLALALEVTERTAHVLVADLVAGGYLVKVREGRRNRYLVQPHVATTDSIGIPGTIGQVLQHFLPAEPVIDLDLELDAGVELAVSRAEP